MTSYFINLDYGVLLHTMTVQQLQLTMASNIKRCRKKLNYSQAKLAELSGISLSLMVDIENKRSWVSATSLVSLCSALQVEVYEIFKPQENTYTDEDKPIDEKIKENASEILRSQKEQLYKVIDKTFEDAIVQILESEPPFTGEQMINKNKD